MLKSTSNTRSCEKPMQEIVVPERSSSDRHNTKPDRDFLQVEPPKVGSMVVPAARFAIAITLAAWAFLILEQGHRFIRGLSDSSIIFSDGLLYTITMTLLTGSCLSYLISRLANYERVSKHRPAPRSEIDSYFATRQPTLTALVPSYREEERVNKYTLLSASLQEYPQLRVVLLIDDPPHPTDEEHRIMLEGTRTLCSEVNELLRVPGERFRAELDKYDALSPPSQLSAPPVLRDLAGLYSEAANWLNAQSQEIPRDDHVDEFMAIDFFQRMKADLEDTASALRLAAGDPDVQISSSRIRHLYLRLVNIFSAEVVSFERKLFASLSAEANKAMNLNSYIGLMGGSYEYVDSPHGTLLVETEDPNPDLKIPDSDYLLTLDADSILLPEYCLRLVHRMEMPENRRTAVAQVPYSSFPFATSKLEQIAAATTDIQHIVHQGLEKYCAAFWVGANAVIRKAALMQLEEVEEKDGILIRRYINDRTVIEDTESSIALRALNWSIYNYPTRLSYSATPPDFGALSVQRQRWANGGLIIMPRLLSCLFGENGGSISMLEGMLRLTYLASIAWSSLCLCVLFFYPFSNDQFSLYAVFAALPYFCCMAFDLRWLGYRLSDILKVYGLNLLLLPINIMGTIESIVQVIGGYKISFARTPKVNDRTVSPLLYLVVPIILMVWSIWALRTDVIERDMSHFVLTLVNLTILVIAFSTFIGTKNLFKDVYFNLREFVYVSVSDAGSSAKSGPNKTDYRTLLAGGDWQNPASDVANRGGTGAYNSTGEQERIKKAGDNAENAVAKASIHE